MDKRSAISRLVPILLLLAAGAAAQDSGTWLELEHEAAAGDTLVEGRRLGERENLDYGQSEPPDSLAADAFDALLGQLFMRPALEFKRSRLQDVLRENLLMDEENASAVEVFGSDSTLAMALYQLRGEEFPHYHPLSDLWIYIWRGRGKLMLEAEESDYEPGEFLQIPAGFTHSLRNLSGAPTVALIWQRPPVVDSLIVEFIPEDILEQMLLDSLRTLDLQERSLYRSKAR